MPRKSVNEAAIALPPVSEASVPAVKKTRKKVVPASVEVKPAKAVATRRKAATKPATESIAKLSEAIETQHILSTQEIEERAYQSWLERGCPMGSPEEDWYRAERELIAQFATSAK